MSEARYLADTHILLWALADDRRLTAQHRAILLSGADIFFSAASIWEIAIKKSLGKLNAPDHLADLLERAGYHALDVKMVHAEAVADLPLHHGDPFDRLLIAQGRLEKLKIMTVDNQFSRYDVEIV